MHDPSGANSEKLCFEEIACSAQLLAVLAVPWRELEISLQRKPGSNGLVRDHVRGNLPKQLQRLATGYLIGEARPVTVAVDTLAGDLPGAERRSEELENRYLVIAHTDEETPVVSRVRAGEGHCTLAIHDAGDISGGGSG